MRVGTPSELARAKEYFLGAHLEDHVGMRADPDSLRRDLMQHRVQLRSIVTVGNRIDPHQDAIEAQQLIADLIDYLVRVHRGFGGNIDPGQSFKHRAQPCVRRCRFGAGIAVSPPEQRYFADLVSRHWLPREV